MRKNEPYLAWGECAHCLTVGDLWFYHGSREKKDKDNGKLVAECQECSCVTVVSTMPEFPSDKAVGVKP